MNSQTIHLEIPCSNCNGFNYFEEETGYYACSNCLTVSQIRCGLELDYTFPMKTMKSKMRNNDDDEIMSDDGNLIENDNFELFSQKFSSDRETFMNISTTNLKSSRFETSTFNDLSSIYSRSTRKKLIQAEKTPQQKLIDIQENFSSILRLIIKDFFENKNDLDKSKYNFYNSIIKFDINEKKIFFEIIKRIWINFISIKYKNISNSNIKKKKICRSRINSINEEKELKKNKTKENDNNIKNKISKNFKKKKLIKKKETNIFEQTKLRRITERNVYEIFHDDLNKNNNKSDFYKENNFNGATQKLISLKKFIEEYDQVINFIKKDKCFDIVFETEEDKEKINISNIIEYEQLIKVCDELGINTKKEKNILINDAHDSEDEDLNFESLIHLIFIKQQLQYKTKHDEANTQELIEINSNHFLFLIYQIFYYKKIHLLLNDILFLYNNFYYINNLSFEEINFLFLSNFKKLKAHINWFDKRLDNNSILKKAEFIIEKITNHILKMPDIFTFLCKYVLKILHNNGKIKLMISTKYIIEYICIGIIFFCLKIIYGLNDLPYMCLILNNINKKYFDYDDIELNEKLNIFKENIKDDSLFNLYKSFPTELDLANILINELKSRNKNSLIINSAQRKLTYDEKYKSKYIDINLNYLYKNFYDDFSQDISELEKKYKNTKIKYNIKKKKKKTWKISTTNQFDNKLDIIENPIRSYNPFLKEELNFHTNIYKDNDSNVEFPLPFDTYIRMKKHSQKILINYHRPSEMVFLFLFMEYFKIDYLSLRTIIRLIEYYFEKIYK